MVVFAQWLPQWSVRWPRAPGRPSASRHAPGQSEAIEMEGAKLTLTLVQESRPGAGPPHAFPFGCKNTLQSRPQTSLFPRNCGAPS